VRRTASAATLVALGLAGCGGSTSLSEKQLRSRATALCSAAARRAGRIPTPKAPDGDGIVFLKRGIGALKPELAALRTLRAPSELSAVYKASLEAFSKKIDALEKTVHKLHSGEDPVVAWRTLQEHLTRLEATEDGAWRALQVPACLNG
jgi:hypothetical protein